MGGRTKRTIRTKGNCLEVNVEILVFDDLLGPAVLVVGVTIGASRTGATATPSVRPPAFRIGTGTTTRAAGRRKGAHTATPRGRGGAERAPAGSDAT